MRNTKHYDTPRTVYQLPSQSMLEREVNASNHQQALAKRSQKCTKSQIISNLR